MLVVVQQRPTRLRIVMLRETETRVSRQIHENRPQLPAATGQPLEPGTRRAELIRRVTILEAPHPQEIAGLLRPRETIDQPRLRETIGRLRPHEIIGRLHLLEAHLRVSLEVANRRAARVRHLGVRPATIGRARNPQATIPGLDPLAVTAIAGASVVG